MITKTPPRPTAKLDAEIRAPQRLRAAYRVLRSPCARSETEEAWPLPPSRGARLPSSRAWERNLLADEH